MFFFFKSHRGFRECLAPSLRPTASRESVFALVVLFATVSRLTRYSITGENRVFSVFYVADVTCFSNHFNFPRSSFSNLFPPKSLFYSNPFIFKQDICKISSRYVLLTPFLPFLLRLCRSLAQGHENWGFFENGLRFFVFVNIFLKILIGLCPIFCLCICVGLLWQFELVFRHFSLCSCIVHS